MSLPQTFTAPDGRGSAIHPLLLALYYTAPSLVKAVIGSNTNNETLSHAVRDAWKSIGSSNSAKPVWDLIGDDKLIPADSAELLHQISDLFDAEVADAAAKAIGVKTRIVIESGAKVKHGQISSGYTIGLSIPVRGNIQGTTLQELLKSNFESEKIDYMFPDDVEPVEATKFQQLAGGFQECVVFHLQRYRYDFNVGANAKIYDRVEIPEHMPGKEFAAFADTESAKALSSCSLDLVAVVTHSDEEGYGLILRPDAKGPWFKCCASPASAPTETSLEAVFGGELEHNVGYILFYRVSGGDGLARRMSRLSVKASKAATSALATVSSPEQAKPQAAPEKGGGCCTVQ